MHEYGITQDILKSVMEVSKGRQVKIITLVIGDVSSILDESVKMYFEILAEGTEAEKAELIFKRIEGRFICKDCGEEFPIRHSGFKCPKCQGQKFIIPKECKSFYIESIEI